MRLEQLEVLATRQEEMVMSALEILKAPSPAAANCAASAIVPGMSLRSAAPRRAMRQRKSEQVNARLIERLKAGDQDALEAIFNLYSVKLYNVALRILGDAADTEEVIQDVFWTAWFHRSTSLLASMVTRCVHIALRQFKILTVLRRGGSRTALLKYCYEEGDSRIAPT